MSTRNWVLVGFLGLYLAGCGNDRRERYIQDARFASEGGYIAPPGTGGEYNDSGTYTGSDGSSSGTSGDGSSTSPSPSPIADGSGTSDGTSGTDSSGSSSGTTAGDPSGPSSDNTVVENSPSPVPEAGPTPLPGDSGNIADAGSSTGGDGGGVITNPEASDTPTTSPSGDSTSGTSDSSSGGEVADSSGTGSGSSSSSSDDTTSGNTGSETPLPSDGGTAADSGSGSLPGDGGTTSSGNVSSGDSSSGDSSSGGSSTDGSLLGDNGTTGGTADASLPGDGGSTVADGSGSAGGGTSEGGSASGGDPVASSSPSPSPVPLACPNEVFKTKLNAVCSVNARKENVLVFPRAYHPIMAIEARVPVDPIDSNPRSHYNVHHASVGLDGYLWQQARATFLLETIDLTAEDLFGPQFRREVTLDYSKIDMRVKAAVPEGWSKVWVTVYVCDDTNRDRRCSDEAMSQQLSIRSPTFQACHFPSAVPVEVYRCGK